MEKKAQSLSINTIVVAAIALFVMVLLIVVVVGNMSKFRKNADACGANGGRCMDDDDVEEKCSGTYDRTRRECNCYDFRGEIEEGKVCCVST